MAVTQRMVSYLSVCNKAKLEENEDVNIRGRLQSLRDIMFFCDCALWCNAELDSVSSS